MAECGQVLGVCCSSCWEICSVTTCYGTCITSCETMGAMLGPANCCVCCSHSQSQPTQWRNEDAPYVRQTSGSFSGAPPPAVAAVPVTLQPPVSIQPPKSPLSTTGLKGSAV